MEPHLTTNPKLLSVLEVLKQREPIFHRPECGTSHADFENMTVDDFWEVGASGKTYSRECVISTVVKRYEDPNYVKEDIWKTTNFHCREIAPDNYLLTYTLFQGHEQRKTRRVTLWRYSEGNWKIIYHQGTVVQR